MLIYDLFGSLAGENYRMVIAVGLFCSAHHIGGLMIGVALWTQTVASPSTFTKYLQRPHCPWSKKIAWIVGFLSLG